MDTAAAESKSENIATFMNRMKPSNAEALEQHYFTILNCSCSGIFLHPLRGVNTPYFFTYTPSNLIW